MKARLLIAVLLGALCASLGVLLTPRVEAQVSGVVWFNKCVVATLSDTVDLPLFSQNGVLTGMFYVGAAGNVVAVNQDNSTVLFTAVPAGVIVYAGVRRINATGTTGPVTVCYRI